MFIYFKCVRIFIFVSLFRLLDLLSVSFPYLHLQHSQLVGCFSLSPKREWLVNVVITHANDYAGTYKNHFDMEINKTR